LVVFALLAALARGSVAHAAEACTFAYADDFSGDAVVTDSYSHSDISGQFCTMCFSPWLMFVTDSTGNRGLGMYGPTQGWGPVLVGTVAYQFPQGGAAGEMTGRIELDLLSCPSLAAGWGFGHAIVKVSYDSAPAVVYVLVTQAGHYAFDVNAPAGTAKVNLVVEGALVRLDNLAVCLDAATPTIGSTWGAIKATYR
jgi:hypothetical protein